MLKAKLHAAGISGAFHDWLSSYLSNRRQFVAINGVKSNTQPVEVGVPQGSLLGPRLFTLYVNDLPAIETAGHIHMFADDTTIYYIGKDVETIVDALNSILLKFYNWCQQNKLTVHAGKTEAMLISGTPFIGPMREIKFGESTIQFKEQSKCLGVLIDNKLSWRPQVDAVRKQYAAKLKQLKCLKGLPSKVLEEIYYNAIVSTVSYCISIWATSHVSLINQLESLHIKAAKLIHGIPSKTSENEVLDLVQWKPLIHIYKRRLASLMFQIHTKSLPKQLVDLFERKETPARELRSKNCFTQIRPRTERGRLSIRFRGPAVWGVIPPEMKELKTFESFKRKLKSCGHKLNTIQFDKGQVATTFMESNYKYF